MYNSDKVPTYNPDLVKLFFSYPEIMVTEVVIYQVFYVAKKYHQIAVNKLIESFIETEFKGKKKIKIYQDKILGGEVINIIKVNVRTEREAQLALLVLPYIVLKTTGKKASTEPDLQKIKEKFSALAFYLLRGYGLEHYGEILDYRYPPLDYRHYSASIEKALSDFKRFAEKYRLRENDYNGKFTRGDVVAILPVKEGLFSSEHYEGIEVTI